MQLNLSPEIMQSVNNRLAEWDENNIIDRIWNHDPTVWKPAKEDDEELSDRLGWLNLPEEMQAFAEELSSFAEGINEYFDDVVLLGMGGSSLAPEVFYKTFGNSEDYPALTVLDSTHPQAVRRIMDNFNLLRTLFVVASKSGGTTETMSFYYTAYDALSKLTSEPGSHFVAITDSGSSLEKIAAGKEFRRVFTTPSDVGGRYSVLTYFGLVPAALIGIDVKAILSTAEILSAKPIRASDNEGFILGAVLGELALRGIDKLTIIASPAISSFAAWVEQLVAESTGKEGKGILPVVDEPVGDSPVYGKDRVFVYLRLENDDKYGDAVAKLKDAEFPVIAINLTDEYTLGREFYRWELATALAGAVLQINPFNQPNVQLAKTLAKEKTDAYLKEGKLPQDEPVLSEGDIEVYGNINADSINDLLPQFLASASEGAYAAIMGFIPPDSGTDAALEELRTKIRDKFKIAVTVGYGPRFLHSTGQLHKGDGNNGLFIQFTSGAGNDLDVPGQGYSFGTLAAAQAQGDMQALVNTGRKVIRLHFNGTPSDGIRRLTQTI